MNKVILKAIDWLSGFMFTKKEFGNPIICVDFDGVIHSYTSGWKGEDVITDPPVEGAIEWLMDHLPVPDELGGSFAGEYKGPEVVIYSSRSKHAPDVKRCKIG